MNQSTSETRSFSCQCAMTLYGSLEGNKELCEYNSQPVANYARNSLAVIGLSWVLDQKKKWYGTYTDKPDGSWDRMTEEMMANFSRSGHPIFLASSAFERGELRGNGGGKRSTHTNGGNETIELLLRTVISANQLSIHGAIADLCDEVPKRIRAPVKLAGT